MLVLLRGEEGDESKTSESLFSPFRHEQCRNVGEKLLKMRRWASPGRVRTRAGRRPGEDLAQAPKKGINIILPETPLLDPPPRPPRDSRPRNYLCLGPPFPSKFRKRPKHKEFRKGGVLGGPKFFMLKFFVCVLLCALQARLGEDQAEEGREDQSSVSECVSNVANPCSLPLLCTIWKQQRSDFHLERCSDAQAACIAKPIAME